MLRQAQACMQHPRKWKLGSLTQPCNGYTDRFGNAYSCSSVKCAYRWRIGMGWVWKPSIYIIYSHFYIMINAETSPLMWWPGGTVGGKAPILMCRPNCILRRWKFVTTKQHCKYTTSVEIQNTLWKATAFQCLFIIFGFRVSSQPLVSVFIHIL